jgi:phosphonate transport system substrate-binding protein
MFSKQKVMGAHVGKGDTDPFFTLSFQSFGTLCLLVFFCLIVISGCRKKEPVPSDTKKTPGPSLIIGLVPEQNIFEQLERYEPIAEYLSKKTGFGIRLKALDGYDDVITEFAASKLDGAFVGSLIYTVAHAKLGVEVIARPENPDGTSTYHGQIIARRDSGIKTAADMKGKRFAFVDMSTTAGYLFPLIYFKEHRIADYNKYFGEVYFAGTHEEVINDVLNKRADIGAVKSTIYDKMNGTEQRIRDALVVIASSREMPENALVLRKGIAGDIRDKLKGVLLGMDTDPEGVIILKKFGSQKFIETRDEDYRNLYDCAKILGLDLSKYDSFGR